MTPTAYHRLRWRERNKERMLRISHAGTICGIALLAVVTLVLKQLLEWRMGRRARAAA